MLAIRDKCKLLEIILFNKLYLYVFCCVDQRQYVHMYIIYTILIILYIYLQDSGYGRFVCQHNFVILTLHTHNYLHTYVFNVRTYTDNDIYI